MLVLFSDIHLTDGTSGETISAEAFGQFADQVAALAARRQASQVRIVLLGDGLDVIRSTQWLAYAPTCRPWSPAGGGQEAATLDILRAILARNRLALEHLRRMPARVAEAAGILPGRVRFDYILGNHDWLINRYPSCRSLVAEHLRLPRLYVEHRFPTVFVSPAEAYDVVARHGHEYDPQNYNATEGPEASSLGDAVVVELVNRLPLALAHELAGDAACGEMLRRLKEMDNVRPYSHVPAWTLDALAKSVHNPHRLQAAARRAAQRCVDDFRRNPEFGRMIRLHLRWYEQIGFRLFLEQVRRMKVGSLDLYTALADRLVKAARIVTNKPGSPYAGHALSERGADGKPPQFVVYGHTHRLESVPLGPSVRDGSDRFYLNTGTWRPVWELARTADGSTHFASWKEMSYVVIYEAGEGGRAHEFEVRSGLLRDRPGAPPSSAELPRQEPQEPREGKRRSASIEE
jgi:UDP-2,3-diacylglucosamine pyrophosphatase LpxH